MSESAYNSVAWGRKVDAEREPNWGSRDRDRAARAEQQAAELSSLGLLGERDKPPDHVMAWQLYGPTKADEEQPRTQPEAPRGEARPSTAVVGLTPGSLIGRAIATRAAMARPVPLTSQEKEGGVGAACRAPSSSHGV